MQYGNIILVIDFFSLIVLLRIKTYTYKNKIYIIIDSGVPLKEL